MNQLMGKKIGMNQFINKTTKVTASTLLNIGPCFVIKKTLGYTKESNVIQIGYGFCSEKQLKSAPFGHLQHLNLIPLMTIQEFLVPKSNKFRIGQILDASFFINKVFITIRSTRIGKGFCGVIKRYNFVRGPLTHGSKNHRQPGSIGQGTTPGRVFKGKKLSGNLGKHKKRSINLAILKIDLLENLLWIKGNIAGFKNSFFTTLSKL